MSKKRLLHRISYRDVGRTRTHALLHVPPVQQQGQADGTVAAMQVKHLVDAIISMCRRRQRPVSQSASQQTTDNRQHRT